MPRLKEENERIKDERREKIERAALKIFAARGLAATKISDIATAAEMSLGLIYHYYASKEELFENLVRRAIDSSLEVLRAAMAMPVSPREKLHYIYGFVLEGFRRGPYTYMVVLQAATSEAASPELRQIIYEQGMEYRTSFTQMVEDGKAAGQFRLGSTKEMVELLFIFIQGAALSAAFYGGIEEDITPESILRTIDA